MMTAENELQLWLDELGKKRNESDKELYIRKIKKSILSKNREEQIEGLIALKESLRVFILEIELL